MRIFVKERKESAEIAGKLADGYEQARKAERKAVEERKKSGQTYGRYCQNCGKPGHLEKYCKISS